jgi:hypothetical protein
MSLSTTVFDRLKKFFRVVMRIPTATLTEQTELGDRPLGFADEFIDSDLRHRINRWFDDIVVPFPGGQWDAKSTLGQIAKDVVDAATTGGLGEYRTHATEEANHALDRELGVGGTSVPVSHRPAVRDHLNVALIQLLIRDATLGDLAGDRSTILDALIMRMVS